MLRRRITNSFFSRLEGRTVLPERGELLSHSAMSYRRLVCPYAFVACSCSEEYMLYVRAKGGKRSENGALVNFLDWTSLSIIQNFRKILLCVYTADSEHVQDL